MNLSQFEPRFIQFISEEMTTDAAHDLNHIFRVVKTARQLAIEEQAQLEIVIPAAYLHDCFTYPKDHPERKQSAKVAADKACKFLLSINYPAQYIDAIHHAIMAHSYSAGLAPETLEAQIVQDADRLDAIGAIGIARCIQVGVSFGTELYHYPDILANRRELDDKRFTIDHFYVKLFKIADSMQTRSAKKEAQKRKAFMQQYIEQLRNEVE